MVSVKLLKRKRPSGQTWLFLITNVNGARSQEALKLSYKTPTERKEVLAIAESIRAKRQLELQAKGHDYVPEFKKDMDFIDYFAQLIPRKNRSWNSVLIHLRGFHKGPLPIRSVDKEWLRAFQQHLLNTVTVNSADTYYNKVKAALREAEKDGIIVRSVASDARIIRRQQTHRTFLNLEEIKRLIATPCKNAEVKRAFLFSCYAGLRISDVRQLRWSNIIDNRIHFTQRKTGGAEYLPMNATALSYLGTRKQSAEKVFDLPKGDWTVWNMVRQWGEEAKRGREISFHVARHSFATMALENGADITFISKMLGHTDLKHTMVYTKISSHKLAEAMNVLPSPFG